jgi:hypothetical protein
VAKKKKKKKKKINFPTQPKPVTLILLFPSPWSPQQHSVDWPREPRHQPLQARRNQSRANDGRLPVKLRGAALRRRAVTMLARRPPLRFQLRLSDERSPRTQGKEVGFCPSLN